MMKKRRRSNSSDLPEDATGKHSPFFTQQEGSSLLQKLEALKPHDHLCLIYETPEQWRQAVIPFIAIGINRGERCIYIVDEHSAEEIRKRLGEEGLDVGRAEEKGQLSVLKQSEVYTKEESFDPDRMIALIARETEKAVSQGYPALRVTGEMTWVLKGHPGAEKLLEYEAKLNRDLFPKYPCLSICQYNRWKFEPELIRGIMMTHPLLIYNNEVYRNLYYIPPDEYLSGKRAEKELQHWLNSVKREEEKKVSLEATAGYLDRIINGMLDPLLVIDMDYKVVDVNQCFVETYNSSREKVIGRHCFEVTHGLESPCSGKDHICPLRHVLDDGMPARVEHLHKDRFGKDLVVEIHAFPMLNPDGSIKAVVEVQRDITEQKQAEEAVKRSEWYLRSTLDGLSEHIAVLDERGYITLTNRAYRDFAERNGIEARNVSEGINYLDVCNGAKGENSEGAEYCSEGIREVLSGKRQYFEMEYQCHSPNEKRWFLMRVTPFPVEDCRRVVVVHENITNRIVAEEARRKSEEQLSSILNNMRDVVWSASWPDIKLLFLTPSAEKLFGRSVKDFYNNPELFKVITHQDDQHLTEKAINQLAEKGEAVRECRVVRPDGSIVWVNDKSKIIYDETQHPVRVDGLTVDVTDKANAEQALKESEDKYKVLFSQSMEAIYLHDLDGQIVEVNEVASEQSGYSREELTNMSVFDLHPEDPGSVNIPKDEILKQWKSWQPGQRHFFDAQHQRRDGSIYPVAVSTGKVTIGDQVFILAVVRDVTFYKEQEEKIIQSERYTRSIIQLIPDIVVRSSKDGEYLDVIAGSQDKLIHPAEELIGKNINDYFPPDLGSRLTEAIRASIESNSLKQVEYELQLAQGNLWFEARFVPSDNNEVLALIRDITDLKQAEKEAQELRDRAEMSSRLAAVGEMASGIAHEINNPLTGVIGFSELLAREDLPPETLQHVRYILEGSQRVKSIVKRMLTFARQHKPFKTKTGINGLIDNTLDMRKYVLETANIEVVKKYDPGLPWVTVDPGQIQQVFLNIIINAEHAMRKASDGGTLTITTGIINGNIGISFKDDGPGMPEEIISRLFNPFFTTKDPGEGTGLGLSLSRSIILDHGGEIEVDSKPGKGSNFTVKLPLLQNESPVESKQPETVYNLKPGTTAKVLVVDDEFGVRELINKILTNKGHEVTQAASSYAALEQFEGNNFDVVLIDVRMPGMSGKELYEIIVEKKPDIEERIIFISGDTSDKITQNFLKEKQQKFITKPFDEAELLQKINEVIIKNHSSF